MLCCSGPSAKVGAGVAQDELVEGVDGAGPHLLGDGAVHADGEVVQAPPDPHRVVARGVPEVGVRAHHGVDVGSIRPQHDLANHLRGKIGEGTLHLPG